MNAALSHWDEYDAAPLMPEGIRRATEPPTLGRDALKDLQRELVARLAELDVAWVRRN